MQLKENMNRFAMKIHLFAFILIFLSVHPGITEEKTAVDPFPNKCADLAEKAANKNTITVQGKDGWLFLAPELRHLSAGQFWGENAKKVSKASRPEYADPLPAILDFNRQLKEKGVELIVVPVPLKAYVYPDKLDENIHPDEKGALPRLDVQHQEFFGILRKHGIKVLDLLPVFMENRFHKDGALYCRHDSHWSGNGCVLAGKKIAEEIDLNSSGLPKKEFQTEWIEIEISGDLWKALNDKSVARERLRVRRTGARSPNGLKPVEPDKNSPVILLGDSHGLVFHAGGDMHTRRAGLADQLAFELGFPVDLVAVRGSGATPARINLFRRVQKNKDYWKNKKYVIWCFSAREFTESDGWRKVPIEPKR